MSGLHIIDPSCSSATNTITKYSQFRICSSFHMGCLMPADTIMMQVSNISEMNVEKRGIHYVILFGSINFLILLAGWPNWIIRVWGLLRWFVWFIETRWIILSEVFVMWLASGLYQVHTLQSWLSENRTGLLKINCAFFSFLKNDTFGGFKRIFRSSESSCLHIAG